MNKIRILSLANGRCDRQTCEIPTLGSGKFAMREIVCFSGGAFSFLSFSFLTFSFSFFSFVVSL
jgi:hypothetical protein